MAIAIDLNADELKVFLQEVEDVLELLDEDIIRLESETQNEELLQEIFRAAHTLKGSSGMVGFEAMAHFTHEMENLLDRVRKGDLAVTAKLVDALLMSLDGLKVLRDDLTADHESGIDVTPIVNALQAAAQSGEGGEAQAAVPERTLGSVVTKDAALQARVQAAQEAGTPLFQITAHVSSETDWSSVRCFQALNEIAQRGELIASIPSQQEIEDGEGGHTLIALVASAGDEQEMRAAVAAVQDREAVEIAAWDGAKEAPADTTAEQAPDPARGAAEPAHIDALSQTVRIDVDQLDALMNMVGELVIDRTRVSQISRVLSSRHKEDDQVRALGETSTHIAKVVDELHERMMQVRMMPVGVLFSKFPRLVRDLARNGGKQVSLVIEGEDTEIDRTVLEELKDPLIHLLRNALDHGVEPPEERAALGKTETAIVRLVARHEQGQIVVSLIDDGRGIDVGRVRESSVRKGLITAEAAERLTPSEALDLIFEPGLSTAEKTTEVSGRGVGMDIVRSGVESLNGRIEVTTEPGQGTTFTMRLPLTLATFRGLLVAASHAVFAIPLNFVLETVRPEVGAIQTVNGRPVLLLRDSFMSLIPLAEALQIPGARVFDGGQSEGAHVVVVSAGESDGDRPITILVDDLVDQQEIVVKSLSGLLGRARGIAGASILGDGEVVLILDVPTLIKGAQQTNADMPQIERVAS